MTSREKSIYPNLVKDRAVILPPGILPDGSRNYSIWDIKVPSPNVLIIIELVILIFGNVVSDYCTGIWCAYRSIRTSRDSHIGTTRIGNRTPASSGRGHLKLIVVNFNVLGHPATDIGIARKVIHTSCSART